MPSIAVIGAGISGLSCASSLQAKGFSVQVFEKSRGPGGRLSSKRMDTFSIDMGAPFFEISNPRFQKEVERWCEVGWTDHWDTAEIFLHPHDPAGSHFYAVGSPRMSAIGRGLSADLTLHTEVRITELQRDGEQWRLQDDQNRQHGPFDLVIVSAPAPQALQLVADHSEALKSLAQREMQCCWVALLHFSRASLRVAPIHRFEDGPLRMACCDNAKPQRAAPGQTWTLYAAAEWSQQHADAPADWVSQQLLDAFLERVKFISRDYLCGTHGHRWLYAVPASPGTEFAQWDENIGLAVCGDWLGEGNVQSAWLSGQKAAEALPLHS